MMITYASQRKSLLTIRLTGSVRGYAKFCNPFVDGHGSLPSTGSSAVVHPRFHPPQSE